MVEVIFRGGILQKGDRIKIPKPIIDTLDIKQGEKIVIYFNPEKKEIVIKLHKKT